MQRIYTCPYCWQWIETTIDVSILEQTYLEDCEVCCRPIEIHYCLSEVTSEDIYLEFDGLDPNIDHFGYDMNDSFVTDDENHTVEEYEDLEEGLEKTELALTSFEVRRENGGEWG